MTTDKVIKILVTRSLQFRCLAGVYTRTHGQQHSRNKTKSEYKTPLTFWHRIFAFKF